MEKKLPKVFANKIEKSTNEKVYYSKNEERSETKPKIKDSKTVYQKIDNIFNSYDYVYKADVEIITKEGKYKKTIIGKSKGHLVTLENELIPILDIIDIKKI